MANSGFLTNAQAILSFMFPKGEKIEASLEHSPNQFAYILTLFDSTNYVYAKSAISSHTVVSAADPMKIFKEAIYSCMEQLEEQVYIVKSGAKPPSKSLVEQMNEVTSKQWVPDPSTKQYSYKYLTVPWEPQTVTVAPLVIKDTKKKKKNLPKSISEMYARGVQKTYDYSTGVPVEHKPIEPNFIYKKTFEIETDAVPSEPKLKPAPELSDSAKQWLKIEWLSKPDYFYKYISSPEKVKVTGSPIESPLKLAGPEDSGSSTINDPEKITKKPKKSTK